MDALVPPNGTNPGFVVNDESHGYRDFGHHRNTNDVVLHEIADGTRAILNDVGNNSRSVLNEVANTSRFGIKETADASRFLMKEICDVDAHLASTIGEDGGQTRGVVEAGRASAERQLIALRENNDRNFGEARIQIEKNAGDIRRDNLTSFAALDKFLCQNFDNATRDTLKGFADTQLDAARNTAALQLTAAQNAAKLSAELADCCCEVKELVRAEAGTTRELIRDGETQRLRDALAAANQELLTIRVGGVALRAAA